MRPHALFKELGLIPSFVIQPIFAITKLRPNYHRPSLRMEGGELLLRLKEDPLGVHSHLFKKQSPTHLARFFDIVEQDDRLADVDLYALDVALDLIESHWSILNPYKKRPLKLNINITPQTLLNEEVLATIHDQLQSREKLVHNLCFELVESYELSRMSDIVKALKSLQMLGATIAFDDFGAGFMNIEKIPQAILAGARCIKIDYQLTSALDKDKEKIDYVKRVLKLSEQMHLSVLAEGVESRSIYDAAIGLGFHYAQGRWLEKELPIDVFFDLVLRQSSSRLLLTKSSVAIAMCE